MACNEPDEIVLFLWQNDNTVVIGRNQNPYKECDIKKLKEDGVQLVRRMSGGGAVYHDSGNLNFSFIADNINYDAELNINVILKGISRFGIHGYFNGRNDLMVQGRKFSGNAFINRNGIKCHHGTLLVDADLDRLASYLTVSPLKLQSKGIASVASRIINLSDISKEINIESLKAALIDSFNKLYKTKAQIIAVNEKTIDVTAYLEKYASWEWNYSESPDFAITLEGKFAWGIIEIHMELSDGKIKACRLFTDAILTEDFKSLEEALQNQQLKSGNIIKVIDECIDNNQIKLDLCSLINNKL